MTGDACVHPALALACPQCRALLPGGPFPLACTACGAHYALCDGFPDLIVGERFPDQLSSEELVYEEAHCLHTTREYWIPMFRRLYASASGETRVLSMGCGVGVEVDCLAASGFDCVGIDNGNRTSRWQHRAARDRLLLANGLHLPFPDAAFDIVFCGCVFPHVGVVGDTFETRPGFALERAALAAELARVLKPGGRLFAASPNRLFPLDLFHGRAPGSYRPRLNSPADPFLLSVEDYRQLFAASGCTPTEALPVAGYWMFDRSQASGIGRLLTAPVRLLFALSSCLPALHGAALTPWIVVSARKADQIGVAPRVGVSTT